MSFQSKEKATISTVAAASNAVISSSISENQCLAILVFNDGHPTQYGAASAPQLVSMISNLSQQLSVANLGYIAGASEVAKPVKGSTKTQLSAFVAYLRTLKADKTAQGYFYDARNVLTIVSKEHFDDVPLDALDLSEITVSQINATEQLLFKGDGLKPSTLGRLKQGWNRFCAYVGMSAWKFSSTVNAAHEYKDDVVSNEAVFRMLDYCRGQRQSAKTIAGIIRWYRREISIRLGWEMGFRSCEYGNAKFNEVEKDGRITIKNSKHNGTRTVAVTNETKIVILELKEFLQKHRFHLASGGIFEKVNGKMYSTSTFRRWLKKVANACEILDRQAKTHGLRHRFARNFHSHARDEFMLADIMGHKSTATTRTYAAKTFEELRDTMQAANDRVRMAAWSQTA